MNLKPWTIFNYHVILIILDMLQYNYLLTYSLSIILPTIQDIKIPFYIYYFFSQSESLIILISPFSPRLPLYTVGHAL